MQSKEILSTETRLLTEIVKSMPESQVNELKRKLTSELRCTERAVDYWFEGRKPNSYSQQKDIARVVKQTLGLEDNYKILAETLFS